STQSAPASFTSAAPWTIRFGFKPRGGSTSTLMTNSPLRTFRASGELSSGGGSVATALCSGRPGGATTSAGTTTLRGAARFRGREARIAAMWAGVVPQQPRSEEHTSELQSRFDLVCRLLLE